MLLTKVFSNHCEAKDVIIWSLKETLTPVNNWGDGLATPNLSDGIGVNLGFGLTNALSTANPCCCKELSLVSPVPQLGVDD